MLSSSALYRAAGSDRPCHIGFDARARGGAEGEGPKALLRQAPAFGVERPLEAQDPSGLPPAEMPALGGAWGAQGTARNPSSGPKGGHCGTPATEARARAGCGLRHCQACCQDPHRSTAGPGDPRVWPGLGFGEPRVGEAAGMEGHPAGQCEPTSATFSPPHIYIYIYISYISGASAVFRYRVLASAPAP